MRVDKLKSLHESFLNFHCMIKGEQKLHESWQARVYIYIPQLSLLGNKRRVVEMFNKNYFFHVCFSTEDILQPLHMFKLFFLKNEK